MGPLPPTHAAGSRSGSSVKYVRYQRVVYTDGQLCRVTAYRREDAPEVAGVTPGGFGSLKGIADYPLCPAEAAAAPEAASAGELALSFWHEVPLPEPEPHIAPGRAITGLDAYLETRGVTTAGFSSETPLGPMQISASGSYTVDWGDGTTTGPYAIEGRPWPDGSITHQYRWVGSYDVVVTESWVATWRLGDETGTLAELRTTGTIPNFPVQEIQAVVGR